MIGYANIGVILALFIGIPLTYASSLSVKEEQDAGTFVGVVDGINNDYTLASTPDFYLEGTSLFTNTKIDRESLSNDVIRLIAVSRTAGKAPVEIEVTVIDINDNDPQFTESTIHINVPETTNSHSKHILPFAEDRDAGVNAAIQSYEIISGDRELFHLSLGSSLFLELQKPIDREEQSRYDLNISALDGGTPPRRGYLHVVVNVLDINDNEPKFTQDEYNFNVPENMTVGEKLFAVKAEDEDAGQNGLVKYILVSQPEPGTFLVNATTGDIILAKALDRETRSKHTLKVTAIDGGSPSMPDDALVHVKVTDVNDNDPVMSFIFPQKASVASIEENEKIAALVAFVSVSDRDLVGKENDIEMDIVEGNELGVFSLENLGRYAIIRVANNESLKQQPFYNLTIRAVDPDPSSQRFSLATMIVVVNSGENHPPVFDRKIYNVTISETLPLGSVVVGVHATDNDVGLNGRLAYSISKGNELGWFHINRSTGLITTVNRLHFEQNGSITLHLSVKDETKTPLSDDATLRITLRDENDNAPVFSKQRYNFNIAENQVGKVGDIEATDKDYGLNGAIQYEIESVLCIGNELNNVVNTRTSFNFQPSSGTIKVNEGLDREYCSKYILQASATDMGIPKQKTVVEITVDVIDMNDNDPVMYPVRYFARIATDASIGTIVARVIARDSDSLDQNKITYHMKSATLIYRVTEETGEVTLIRSVADRDGENHTLELYARDTARHVSRQHAVVTVLVNSNFVIETAFSKEQYSFYLQENSEDGFVVGNVELEKHSDVDVTMHITEGNHDSAFRIDASGVIYVDNATHIDAEMSELRNLTVVAELRDASSYKAIGFISTICLVHIVDVNDNFPRFVSLPYSVKYVEQNSYRDSVTVILSGDFEKTAFYEARAADDDVTSRDQDISYQVYSSFPGFEIDPMDGVVYLTLAHMAGDILSDKITMDIEISACDIKGNPKCATLLLNVTLLFVKNIISRPMENIFVEVSENTVVGSQVGNVPFLEDLYQIHEPFTVSFALNPETPFRIYPMGEIIVSEKLDFEKSPGYQLSLIAKIEISDHVYYKRSWLTTAVEDGNDNLPIPTQNNFQFSVKEFANPDDFVGTVSAYDADKGIYGSVVYEIKKTYARSGADLFYCDKFTGDIFLTQAPNRKVLQLLGLSSDVIDLVVIASDQNGRNSSSSECRKTTFQVKVAVELENMYPLYFEFSSYDAAVPENHAIADILTVQAMDADSLWLTNKTAVHYGLYIAGTKNQSSHFVIGKETGIVGLKDGVLLDREEQEFHHLILQAKYIDGSETAFSDLYIRVLDVKDAPPVFSAERYQFSVTENVLTRAPIGRVEARDGDLTSEATRITYRFRSITGEMFEIDESSGFLFISRALHYEEGPQHTLTIVASDESGEETVVTVDVNVIKNNHEVPEVEFKVFKGFTEGYYSSKWTVAESYGNSDTKLQYTLVSPVGIARKGMPSFQVDPTLGKVTLTGEVDREVTEELKVTVRVSTSQTTKFRDYNIILKVHDVNDNAPFFTSRSTYLLPLESAKRAGDTFTRITADDKDDALNGLVTTRLANPGESKFDMDKDGYLTIRSPIDVSDAVHAVDVIASDGGSPSKSTRATIYVIFYYDTSSIVKASLPKVHLPETAAKGSLVTTVPGSSESATKTRFFMGEVSSSTGDREANDMFSINSETGAVVSNTSLIDSDGSYKLNVVTVEELPRARRPRVSTRTITVEISDENNNPPEFPNVSMRVPASESLLPGTIVATVEATDRDASDVLTYTLSSKVGDLGSDFVINSKTGVVTVGASGLDRERKSEYQLEVTADDGTHRSSTELWIDIEDVNDEAPAFISKPICFDLKENSPYGTVIGHLETIDRDLNSNVEYSIIDDTEMRTSNFFIDQNYGTIKYIGAGGLNRESQDLYVLDVRATDEGGMFSDGKVFIYIIDENDHQPILRVKGEDRIEISENTHVGSVIADVEGTDDDLGLNQEIYYSIISGDPYGHFRIGTHSGTIRTNASLDREELSQYNLTIMGRNKFAGNGFEQFSTVSLSVNLLDENDNKPYFTTDLIVYLEEDALNGDLVANIKALDADQDFYATTRYHLVNQLPNDGIFVLNEKSGRLTVSDNRNLDYETTKQYILTIKARDKEQPSLSSTGKIVIHIVDVNDNSPTFERIEYSAQLQENVRVGTHILQVVAQDRDTGLNSQIQYRIMPSTNATFFHINRYTGDITLFNNLDYERQQMISAEIEATDGGAHAAYCKFTLTVQDINDCSPVISPSYAIVHVPENSNSLSLSKFTAIDNDSGSNGVPDINGIQPQSDFFQLDKEADGSALLDIKKSLDREIAKHYEFSVIARDQGYPPRKGAASVLVIVDNRNEFEPIFDQFEYFSSISESASPGTFITSVKASDGDGSGIWYNLKEEKSLPFYIDHDNGGIYLRGYLDREVMSHYNISVIALDEEDEMGLQHQTTVTLIIAVTDINDNAPVFTNQKADIFIDSVNSVGTVAVVEAIDIDAGDNGRVTYSIVKRNPAFAIDSTTGEIKCVTSLKSAHNLTIRATDSGAEPRFTDTQFHFYLINDRRPVISHNRSTTSYTLMENLNQDRLIGTFQASSSRGSVHFRLIGDRFGWFTLDSITGKLLVSGNIDRELASTVTLWVEAKDSGTPSLMNFENVNIQVKDANDNKPVFTNKVFTKHVKEDMTAVITEFSATDADDGLNGEVSIFIVESLSEDPNKFSLSQDGLLTNKDRLDRETKSSYKLVIRASDHGLSALQSDVVFRVIVDDVNEHQPKFDRLLTANILEDMAVGSVVLKVSSIDDDELSNHTYRLTDNPGQYFNINQEGFITVAKELDRESLDTHALEVEAFDGIWSKSASVTIRLDDVNDNAPRFSQSQYRASVSVNASHGTVVMNINATDADIGNNGRVNYEISGGSMYFHINENGQITTSNKLRCKNDNQGCPVEHHISIIACDSGLPNLQCSSANVVIAVKSINNHSPQLVNKNEIIAVLRSTPTDTMVCELFATDADAGTVLTYTILNDKDYQYFSIASGNHLSVVKPLTSLNEGHKLTVDVQVSDDGVPMKIAVMEYQFEVTGENKFSPVFDRISYLSNPVLENNPVPRNVVISVQAKDDDSGLNGLVKYEIVDGNEEGKFGIDEISGVISLQNYLDYEITHSYELVVTATDSAMTSKQASVVVTIPVADENDHVPYFNSSEYEIRVFENTPVGINVARILAIDEDSGSNAKIQYSIETASVIDVQESGGIYLTSGLDYENQTLHIAQIFASNDPGSKSQAQIDVSVLGRNEFSPVIVNPVTDFRIPHLAGHGSLVGTINATDLDGGVDGIVEYLMIPNNHSKFFHLHKSTGKLSVIDLSSYKVGDRISILVIAKNPTTSSEFCLFDQAAITIQVISNECHKLPCKNGATCEDGPSRFLCYCLPGFTGIDCGINIDDCKLNPCVHGTCTDGVNAYQCACQPGYTGRNCDVAINFCESSPCLNGGKCTSEKTTFKCECPFGATGVRCEIQSLNFPPQSYIVLPAFIEEISFQFSTVFSDALLFYSDITSLKYLILEILNGKLQLTVKQSGNRDKVLLNLSSIVNDGLWHTIAISFVGRTLSISLDGCPLDRGNECIASVDLDYDMDLSSSDLTIGGIQQIGIFQEGKLSSHDFVGCMRAFTFDSNIIESSSSFHIKRKNLIGDGCAKTVERSACSTDTCKNEGTCNDEWTKAICTCPDGWQGPRCESKMNGHTFTGKGYASISFTESFFRDALLKSSITSARKRRSGGNSESSVEFRFRTKESTGMLFAAIATDNDYFGTLYISDGLLHYQHNSSSGPIMLSSAVSISDGSWHNVKISITKTDSSNAEAILHLDGEVTGRQSFSLQSQYGSVVITDFDNPLQVETIYIGGTPNTLTGNVPSVDSFKGCVFHFKLDGIRQQLRSDVENSHLALMIDNSSISESCDGSGLICSLVTCENGKMCVPNSETVSQCICENGYSESGESCVLVAAGFSWWIIVVVLIGLVAVSVAVFLVVLRRRKAKKRTVEPPDENGISSVGYDYSTTTTKSSAPDLVPQDLGVMTDDSEKPIITVSSCDEASTNTFSSQVTLIPTGSSVNRNGYLYGREKYNVPSETDVLSGRKSASDILKSESLGFSIKRPASAQANLVPESLYTTIDRSRVDGPKLYPSASRTLPRKAPNKSTTYLKDHTDTAPRRPTSRVRTTSGTRSATERKRQKRRSRDVETLEIMMQELSGIAGLTKEEMDLLHAGAIALQQNNPDILYEDASSISTSSVTDSSSRSKNSDTSRRSRLTVTPRIDTLARNTTPSPASLSHMPRLDSKGSSLPERYVSLSPFNFPSPMFDSDTEDPNSTSQDDDTWESTSDDTNSSATKQDSLSVCSSNFTAVSDTNPLDLNYPSNLSEYFSTLTNVFEDISRLKSDESKKGTLAFGNQSRRPSVLPGFVSSEVSLWNEIEALSKKPSRRQELKSSIDSVAPSLTNGLDNEGRTTPARKIGMNSPIMHDVIKEETSSQGRESPYVRITSPIDLLESVELELEGNRRRQNISRSSSGRSNRSLKTKPEFVKYV